MCSTFTMRALALGVALSLTGCKSRASKPPAGEPPPTGGAADRVAAPAKPKALSLPALRAKVHTRVHMNVDTPPAPEPPAAIFTRVHYKAPLGENDAYVSPEIAGAKRPAIVWIAGGLDWGIGASDWAAAAKASHVTAARSTTRRPVQASVVAGGGHDEPLAAFVPGRHLCRRYRIAGSRRRGGC